MSDYKFTESMAEISGFGGSYEEACRKMVIAGLEFLDKNPEMDPKFSVYENVHGIINEKNEDAKKLTKAMSDAIAGECTGIMMQACVFHVFHIKQYGWPEYVKKMEDKKVKVEDENQA